MGSLIYQVFSSSALVSLGLYHIISSICSYLKSPHSYIAKLYHPFNFSTSSASSPPSTSSSSSAHSTSHFLRHIQLYVLIFCLLVAFAHQTLVSSDADPLLKGRTPVHLFTSLQSAAVLFLFLLLTVSLLISESTNLLPLPTDLFFALTSAGFFLHYSVASSAASVQTSDLQAKCDSISAQISAVSSLLCLFLACQPRMFMVDVGLGGSLCLQGLWMLQTGLSLYVETFIPEGCHRLLDVVSGIEGSTKCDLEESRLRAVAILDLMFVVHVMVVVVIAIVTYAVVTKNVGIRRTGSYEALPTVAPTVSGDSNHIQMKTLIGTQA